MARSVYYKNLANTGILDDEECTAEEKSEIPPDVSVKMSAQGLAYLRTIKNCIVFMTVLIVISLIVSFLSMFTP